jgi:hypothetical protein
MFKKRDRVSGVTPFGGEGRILATYVTNGVEYAQVRFDTAHGEVETVPTSQLRLLDAAPVEEPEASKAAWISRKPVW